MAVKPSLTEIVFTGTASAAVYCSEVSVEVLYTNFDRSEFLNNRLRTAKSTTGAVPIIVQTIGGVPLQIATVCSDVAAVPLGPDSVTGNLESAKQKMTIYRYTLTAGASLATGISSLLSVAVTHDHLLSLYDFTQFIVNSADVSYTELIAQQAGNYNFLTTSGLNMSGNALGGTIDNVLIRSIKAPTEYEFNNISSGNTLLLGLELVCDTIVISSQYS